MYPKALNRIALLLVPTALVVTGCGGRLPVAAAGSNAILAIHASATQIDTNGTTRFTATTVDGETSKVTWSISGGDPVSGPGRISSAGIYTPPGYLTQESARVTVRALLSSSSINQGSFSDTIQLTITPGFLQPLTPGNLAVGPGGTATISGSMTEVGGTGGIHFALASDTKGTLSHEGTLSPAHCVRSSVRENNPTYTVCTATYTAPASVPTTASVYIVGTVASNPTQSWTRILLNPAGITSNPVEHQAHQTGPVLLGSSSGNNADYDTSQGQLSDCCGGTLGSLLQDTSGTQFVLSNNHVLARSDQAIPGETIIHPGLIDNGCTPYGVGPGTTPVATLTGYAPLSSPAVNVDAAIARVSPGAIDPKGSILELGARQPDGMLAAAPPGISSTAGRGETAALGMLIAKSGRTTGLTCAAVSAISVDIVVDYFTDCAETAHAFTKTFTNQIAMAGASFSDAGDSGALIVDTGNAEPVALFFAGGTDTNGIEHAIANPISDVLATLNTQVPTAGGGKTSYSFVGGADHPVSCINYGAVQSEASNIRSLSIAEREQAEAALSLARSLLSPRTGVQQVSITESKDHPGTAAIALSADLSQAQSLPAFIAGIPTAILPANGVAIDTQVRSASLTQTLAVKQRNAASLFKKYPALFGVGVGQSWDNPTEAAIILFLDRRQFSGTIPSQIDGQRVRAILMDRFHVTRAHASTASTPHGCAAHGLIGTSATYPAFPSFLGLDLPR